MKHEMIHHVLFGGLKFKNLKHLICGLNVQ